MPYPGETSRSVKTTSSGTAYVEVLLTIGGHAAILALPIDPLPVLILVGHGHNGSEETFNQPQFAATLDITINSRWPLLSTNAAGNAWGNDASIDAYVAAWNWAKTNLGTTRTILFGQSMGSLVLANVLSRGLITDQVGFVSIDGALNLAVAHASGSYQAAIRTAYGIASDGSDYAAKTAGHDGVLLPPASFDGTWMVLEASPNDTNIPKTQHTDLFAANITGHPAQLARITGTGAHISPNNYYPTSVNGFIVRALLADALPLYGRTAAKLLVDGVARSIKALVRSGAGPTDPPPSGSSALGTSPLGTAPLGGTA